MSSHHYHPTTMPEYGNNYGYIPPITHGLPSEALSRMGPPPHPQSIHQPQPNHPQLPMLMMPHQTTTTWPSQLVSNGQSPYNHHPVHSVPPIPIPSGPALKTKLPAIQTSQPRKTLTDDDRRRMCQYAEDHPNAKQTDIGARFGVERR
ncbi:hypothetical protein QBC38DRAFT_477170 [Podospora fimiseda]|uniref:HTH psq-type domain-containing protein n=1 Tax=Podospora fimiseda TaxID=252190 RepID=A0AAN7BQQ5_9PEZI|nr:hypothetical protein QBC38DRAFT_477170 [Podospora fimiseda]